MVGPFFRLAMLSLGRQVAFRRAVVVHLLALTAVATVTFGYGRPGQAILGQYLLIAGIVEGALLLGWRLTQLPKSKALEFLLASPLRARNVFVAEALVGLSRLALVTLAGFPILGLLVFAGLEPGDLVALLVMPFTWGAITGLGLITWAYEPLAVRRWGERLILLLILVYLIVGVLAAERLGLWLDWLFPPDEANSRSVYAGFLVRKIWESVHHYSPFLVIQNWFQAPASATMADMVGLEAGALAVAGLLFWRAASRLKGHFHDRHYSPIVDSQYIAQMADRVPKLRDADSPIIDPAKPSAPPRPWQRLLKRLLRPVNLLILATVGLSGAVYFLPQEARADWFNILVFSIGGTVTAIGLVLWRSAGQPQETPSSRLAERADPEPRRPGQGAARDRGVIGNRPLAWWAVRRVTEYSGRVNLWLAGGFGVLYSAYILAGPHWPAWLGRMVFLIADATGGIPMLTTGLVVLAAAPAALQYGLWDSNAQDRCRRLELLLLTELNAGDYWEASTAAAWRRGRGYFYVALLLWGAGLLAGRLTAMQVAGALAAGVILWGLYFVLGFRAFSRGMQASGLGSLLTLGVPGLVIALAKTGSPVVAALLPPGSIYYAGEGSLGWQWAIGPAVGGVVTLVSARRALERCDADLRRWYDGNHGSKSAE
jgi:hypothetical protein